MTHRKAQWLGLMIPFLIGFLVSVSRLPYEPAEPMQKARVFVDLLSRGSYREAFALTTQRARVGRDLEEFTQIVLRQFGRPTNGPVKISPSRPIVPPQTYGNRLRRWVTGRPVERDEVSLDFFLRGEKLLLLFEVRFAHEPSGNWRISYFQSHAG